MAEIDADELLRRIRAARDWAAAEDERLQAASTAGGSDDQQLADASQIYNSIRAVLDEIIEPGKHSREK
ncbi:hypothetical protein [Streptomyces katrae]|uniref:Uncharacterized protein n=1 Tax=Streptomyces katrae TaxID=68223 RepID=A0A0F4IUQ1_9ACTN|nr:hypothetical protein [Streptomyces katrae]KJY25369.1 hypothetical protein VR44_32630 [Streptomyces katrae]